MSFSDNMTIFFHKDTSRSSHVFQSGIIILIPGLRWMKLNHNVVQNIAEVVQ